MSAPSDWLGLAGRVCAVTGAGSGIGRELAVRLAAAGASLVLLDRNVEACRETEAAVAAREGARVLALGCDVTDLASVEAAARQAEGVGPVDVLVNNAGMLKPGPIETLPLADWRALLDVNLTGALVCSQVFGRAMLERGRGALVHVSSIAATQPQAFSGAYSATKAGLVMLSRQMAFEWGPRGVRSNVVSPGLVRTPLSEPFYATSGVAAQREAVVPLRRIGAPGDMADAVLFLASDRAGYVTGQELVVDGGFSQTLMSHVPRPGYA